MKEQVFVFLRYLLQPNEGFDNRFAMEAFVLSAYPIGKIEGLTYAEVEDAIGAAALSTLLGKPEPTQADLVSIRDAINAIGGLATTYTYKPLVGVESQTMPNGNTTRYEYDGFGRLVRVIDNNGDVISTNSYNYKK